MSSGPSLRPPEAGDAAGPGRGARPRLTITPRGVAVFLGVSIAVLALGHVVSVYIYRGIGPDRVPGGAPIARLLNMDGETNAPTWFATSALLAAAGLCAVIWRATPRGPGTFRRHWAGLVLILVFLSVDEGALIHEELSRPLTDRFELDPDAWRYWAWMVPYAALALAIGVAYARFLWNLPVRVRAMVLVGGATFVAGALGMELVGRELFDPDDIDATYLLSVGVEEVLEKIGVSLVIVALVTYLRDHVGPVDVGFGRPAADGSPDG